MVTVKEFEKALTESKKNSGGDWGEDYDELAAFLFYEGTYEPSPTELGVVTVVDEAGGEGEGDSCHVVAKLSPSDGSPDQYFRYDGWYASYDGFYWDEAEGYEVHPTPVMKIEYIAAKESK